MTDAALIAALSSALTAATTWDRLTALPKAQRYLEWDGYLKLYTVPGGFPCPWCGSDVKDDRSDPAMRVECVLNPDHKFAWRPWGG